LKKKRKRKRVYTCLEVHLWPRISVPPPPELPEQGTTREPAVCYREDWPDAAQLKLRI
jgi:hypothetical protein